jgi:hypothetical protein
VSADEGEFHFVGGAMGTNLLPAHFFRHSSSSTLCGCENSLETWKTDGASVVESSVSNEALTGRRNRRR